MLNRFYIEASITGADMSEHIRPRTDRITTYDRASGELISLPVAAEAHRVANRISERLETEIRARRVRRRFAVCAKLVSLREVWHKPRRISRAKTLRAGDAKRPTRVQNSNFPTTSR